MAQGKSTYMPGVQAMPGLNNHQILEAKPTHAPTHYFVQQQAAAAPQQTIVHAAASIPESDCVTAVEGHEVNGRQVGNGTYDPEIARTSVRSSHFQAFYHY